MDVAADMIEKGKSHLPEVLKITHAGHNALSVVCVAFAAATLIFIALGMREAPARREHFYATTVVTCMAFLSYYAMATGYGWTTVSVGSSDMARQFFYARYIDWAVTTPLLLVDVFLLARISWGAIGWVIFADIGMIVTGLLGALIPDASRWGWFALGCIFMLAIFYQLLGETRAAVEKRDSSLVGFYNSLVLGLAALWTAYPIVWALAEGTNYISANVETYCYAVLDVTAKIGFGAVIIGSNNRLMESYGIGRGAVGDAEAALLQE